MKALRLFCVAMMACLAVVACSDDDDDVSQSPNDQNEPEPEPDPDPESPVYVGDAKLSTDSQYYVELSDVEGILILPDSGGTATFTVTGEEEWSATCEGQTTFGLSVDAASGTFTVTAEESSDAACRAGEVTLAITQLVEGEDGAMVATDVVFASVHLVVEGSDGPFVLEYVTSSSHTDVQMPLANMNAVIDWGDGSAEYCTEDYPSHNYATADDYDVNVYGTVKKICSYTVNGIVGDANVSHDYTFEAINPNTTLVAVKSWGGIRVEDAQYAFVHCTSLKSLPEVTGRTFFLNCKFEGAFSHTALEVIPSDIFAESLIESIYRAEGIRNAFSFTNITEIPVGLLDGVSSGCAECMFNGCNLLTTIPETLFDNCQIDDFHRCFYNCTSLTSIPEGLWAGNNNVANAIQTFANCSNVTGESPYGMMGTEKVHLYERDADKLNSGTNGPCTGNECYKGCTGLTDYNDIPSDWK